MLCVVQLGGHYHVNIGFEQEILDSNLYFGDMVDLYDMVKVCYGLAIKILHLFNSMVVIAICQIQTEEFGKMLL